jgi:hypothetical protein
MDVLHDGLQRCRTINHLRAQTPVRAPVEFKCFFRNLQTGDRSLVVPMGYAEKTSKDYAFANKGLDTRTLQAYLGHRSINSTTRYAALAPGRFKNIWGRA